jgi:hypothetical protein
LVAWESWLAGASGLTLDEHSRHTRGFVPATELPCELVMALDKIVFERPVACWTPA